MQQEQTKQLLEEIAANTHPDYIENVPQVHIIGSIGAGKSSFLHGIHKYLRMYNAGLQIEQKRATSANQLGIQRSKGIFRANATVEPERLRVYNVANEKYIPVDFLAEGSHESAKKLYRFHENERYPNAVVFCLDLKFLEHLYINKENLLLVSDTFESPIYEREFLSEIGEIFKDDFIYETLNSFAYSIKKAAFFSEVSVPIISIATHYKQITKKSSIYNQLIDNSLHKYLELFEYIGNRLDQIFFLPNEFNFLKKIFENPICIDSRSKSLYGIETAAHQIAAIATRINPEELKLVSFSNQMLDNQKLIKYENARRLYH